MQGRAVTAGADLTFFHQRIRARRLSLKPLGLLYNRYGVELPINDSYPAVKEHDARTFLDCRDVPLSTALCFHHVYAWKALRMLSATS